MSKLSPQQLRKRHQEKMMKDLVKNSDKWAKEHGIDLKEKGPDINGFLEKNPDIKKAIEENREKVKLDEGYMRRYEKESETNRRHLTTIVGPQAECIRETLRNGLDTSWIGKSVDGLCVIELWIDDTGYWYE